MNYVFGRHLTDKKYVQIRRPSGRRAQARRLSSQGLLSESEGSSKSWTANLGLTRSGAGHLVGSWAGPQDEGNGRYVATSLIFSRGWHFKFICDHAGIHLCYLVGIKYVLIVDRLREWARGLGTKTTTQITARLISKLQGKGIDQITRCQSYGGRGGRWDIAYPISLYLRRGRRCTP